jgi:hypothetical protein
VSDIPDIQVNPINVPYVVPQTIYRAPEIPAAPPVTVNLGFPIIDMPGCVEWHPDDKRAGNLPLEDKDGVRTLCPNGQYPSYDAMDYTPENLIITEQVAPPAFNEAETPPPPTPETDIPDIPNEKKEDVECPGPKDQRIGDLRNAQGKEKVIGHEIRNGECITLYEETTVVDKYVPTTAQVVNTAQIALVAATMPLLIAAVKPAVAQLVKRIPKLLGRKSTEVLSLSQKAARQRSSNLEAKKKNQMGQIKRKKKKK